MKIAVMGGDARSGHLRGLLAQNGMEVCGRQECDAFVLPYPVTKDGKTLFSVREDERADLRELLAAARGAHVLAGAVPEDIAVFARENGVLLTDYALDEELLVKNAVLTAEGAARLYSEATGRAVFGARLVVTGFGRVARAVCRLFHAMGASLAVAARSEEALGAARSRGYAACPLTLTHELCAGAHALFNTVPARVVDRAAVRRLEGRYYFELASAPFGADFDELARGGVTAVPGSGLPGRYMPASAALVIFDAIKKHLTGGHI